MNETHRTRWHGQAALLGAAIAIGLSTALVAPRVQTIGAGLAVLLPLAVGGIALTMMAWPGRASRWRGHRGGLAAAVGALLLLTGLCAAEEFLAIGLRTLSM